MRVPNPPLLPLVFSLLVCLFEEGAKEKEKEEEEQRIAVPIHSMLSVTTCVAKSKRQMLIELNERLPFAASGRVSVKRNESCARDFPTHLPHGTLWRQWWLI